MIPNSIVSAKMEQSSIINSHSTQSRILYVNLVFWHFCDVSLIVDFFDLLRCAFLENSPNRILYVGDVVGGYLTVLIHPLVISFNSTVGATVVGVCFAVGFH